VGGVTGEGEGIFRDLSHRERMRRETRGVAVVIETKMKNLFFSILIRNDATVHSFIITAELDTFFEGDGSVAVEGGGMELDLEYVVSKEWDLLSTGTDPPANVGLAGG
jgi:hypothetical protein